jgi:hypothetical protein
MPVQRRESGVATSSPFADRLRSVIERWAARLPPDLQQAFRRELSPFADEYDRTLDTIENIWRCPSNAGTSQRLPRCTHGSAFSLAFVLAVEDGGVVTETSTSRGADIPRLRADAEISA